MLSKNEVKYIQSLCHKKQRDAEGVFVAEGPKLALELFKSSFEIVKVYAVDEWLRDHAAYGEQVMEISESELGRISSQQTPNQVLIVAKQKVLPEVQLADDGYTLVLDDIQDPGNMGSIVRIADWFGIKQVVASKSTADLYNFKVVQASMGSICRVDVWYKDLADWIKAVHKPVYGGTLNGQSLYNLEERPNGLVVIGNEGRGISQDVLPFITNPVTIPKRGQAESLNAAIATGIILSHLLER